MVKVRQHAITTSIGATARGDENSASIGPALDELPARPRQPGQRRRSSRAVKALEPAGLKIVDEGGPNPLRFANQNTVRMAGGFLRQQCGMRPAEDDRDAAPAKLIRKFIGMGRGTGGRRDADEVSTAVEVNRTDNFVRMMDFNVLRA